MANTDIIDEVVSSDAYKDVLKFTEAMDALEKKFITTAQSADLANAAISGAKGIKELQEATKKLNEENTKLTGVEKLLAETVGKRAAAESELGKRLAEEKVLLQQVNKENANRAKLLLTETGSISRLEAVRDKLLAKQKGLNRETEEGARKNDLYVKSLDRINERIKAGRDARTAQAINVGNYQGSAKIIVDALEREKKKLEELMAVRTKMQNVQNAGAPPLSPAASGGNNINRTQITGFAGGNTSAELSKINQQIENSRKIVEGFNRVTENPKFLNVASKVGDANAELKGMTKSLIELERAGLGETQGAKDLRNELAKLTDEVADARQEIKALSSDSRGFDLFAGSVTFAADAFQTAAGAAVLFGASEEDAAQATATLTAIQSVANGVKGIANELTTRGTAANKVYAFTQGLVATAFDRSAAASKRFIAALGLIGIIATVIGVIVVALGALNKKLSEAEIRQKALNDVINDAASDFGKAKTEVASMTKELELAKNGFANKEVVLKKFNETIGETIGQTTSLEEAEKLLNDKKDDYIAMMFAKSQAAAAFALANKAAEESVKNEAATTDELLSTFDKIKASFKGLSVRSLFASAAGSVDVDQVLKSAAAADKIAEANRNDKRAELQSKYNTFISIGNEKLEEAGKISTENNFTSKEQLDIEKKKAEEAKKAADEAAKERKKRADEEKKMRDDLAKFNIKLSADELKAKQQSDSVKLKQAGDVFKSIADDEKKSMQDRLLANGFYYGTLEKDIANKQQFEKEALLSTVIAEKEQILKRKLNQSEIEGIYQQVNGQLVTIEQKAQADIVAIHRQGIEDQNKIIESGTAQKLESLAKRSSYEIAGINKSESEALAALEYQYNQKLITQEQYETERAKIVADYAGKRLQSELNTAITLLEIMKATGQSVTEQEAKIAAIRLKIAQNLTAGLKAENGQQEADEKAVAEKKKELWNELGMELKETVFSFIDSGFDRQKNALEREKVIIDERKDAEIKRINSLQIAESEKADKIKLLDATVQAQKEQLARKQRQIDAKKAKADKVAAIFGIGINIAQREVEALSYLSNPVTAPMYPFVAALIGAIGAVQLAAVLAKPIPEYWTGTKDSGEAGLAIVGDKRGKELVKLQDGSVYETPSTSTLINLPAHSEVISNPDYQKILNSQYFYSMNRGGEPFKERQFFEWQMKLAEENTERVVQAIKDKPETVLNIDVWGVSAFKKAGHSWQEYMDKKVRFKS